MSGKRHKQLRKAARIQRDIERRSLLEMEFAEEMARLKSLSLDHQPGWPEKANLIRETLRLGRQALCEDEHLPITQRSCFLHPTVLPRIREIGKRIWEITKDHDPDFFAWFFQCDLLSIPRLFRSEIEHAWHGIGWVRA